MSIVLPFFALVVAGYLAARFSILESAGLQGLNKFVYFFALPALLFSKMAATPIDVVMVESLFLVAHLSIGLVVFAVGWSLAKIVLRTQADNAAVIGLAGCYGNIGFLGIPLLVGVLGTQAAAPLSIMLLVDVAVFIPLATILIDVSRAEGRHGHLIGSTLKSVIKNPLILSIIIGLLFSALGWGLPDALGGFTNLLGQAAGPAAMFALGAVLAGRPLLQGTQGLGDAGLISVLKLAVHPLAMWWGMGLFDIGEDWRLAATLGAATPVAAALFVIALEHDAMPVRASTAVVVTTALSILSLPFLIGWLGVG